MVEGFSGEWFDVVVLALVIGKYCIIEFVVFIFYLCCIYYYLFYFRITMFIIISFVSIFCFRIFKYIEYIFHCILGAHIYFMRCGL